jgi:parallel beta-helix repeat protein
MMRDWWRFGAGAASRVALGSTIVLCLTSYAAAGSCGGKTACACGDTVRSDVVLVRDLTGCSATGLKIRSGVVLDCAGHTIAGSGAAEGVLVDGATGAELRNCRIAGFSRGVRLRAGGVNLVEGNEIHANGHYGIELAVATKGNRLVDNVVRDSGDEGIHVGSGADANEIVGNEITRSKAENLYVLKSRGTVARDNTLSQSGAVAIYVKHSSDGTFAGNAVRDRGIQVRGDSSGNLFADNDLRGAGFIFQAYKDDALGWTYPHDNAVNGGSIVGADTCFRFAGSYDNEALDVAADRCQASRSSTLGGRAATGNTVDIVRMR